MSNDIQVIAQPINAVIDPRKASSKDRITIEPMILQDEESPSTKNRRFALSSLVSANKIFAIALFILLIILISYILFHGTVTDRKLSRLTNNVDLNPNDIKRLFEEMNRSLKSIELYLVKQTQKTNINVVLNGKDMNEFQSNQTMLIDFIRRIKEQL